MNQVAEGHGHPLVCCKATLQLHYKKPCMFLQSIKLHNSLDYIVGIQSNM
jgi:hypothetical protein